MNLNQATIKNRAEACLTFWKDDHLDIDHEAWRAGILEVVLESLGVDIQELLADNPMPYDFGFRGSDF